ncbi:MAG TPA: hypothetical protein VID25_01970 [Candidatus Limnocylindrales bacterium]|jgi:hypothetical protein
MALQRTVLGEQIEAHLELARVLLIVGAALLLTLVMMVAFGWHGIAPSYQIVPDPAGILPF